MGDARAGGYVRRQVRVGLTALLGAFAVASVLIFFGFRWWPASLAAVLLLLVYDGLSKRGRWLDPVPWLRGLRGERAVAEALSALPGGFRTIHDLPTSHGNVDHVVVGPTGVFAIETKNYRGRFHPRGGRLAHNGRDATHIVTQATRGAIDVRRRLERDGLSLWVEAMVVSTGAIALRGPLRFGKTTVLDLAELVPSIARRPPRLTPEQVERAASAITSRDADRSPVRPTP